MADNVLAAAVGYYIPISLFAAILLSVGSGLISTFAPSTPTGRWISYQILYGVGRGLGLQMVREVDLVSASSKLTKSATADPG